MQIKKKKYTGSITYGLRKHFIIPAEDVNRKGFSHFNFDIFLEQLCLDCLTRKVCVPSKILKISVGRSGPY
jgi:hypothetical protein